MADFRQRETIIEFRVSGQFGFINAIDVLTGIEVSVTVPAHTSKVDRETLAMRRLAKMLTDLGHVTETSVVSQQTIDNNGGNPTGLPPPKQRGLLA